MNGYIHLNPDMRAINITFDEPQVEELLANKPYAGKLKKCQVINMKNMSDFPHLHHHTWKGMDGFDMLQVAVDLNFNYAIVWADGSWPTSDEFDEKVMEEIEVWNEAGPWLVGGHIIAREGQLPHFHQQCVIVNLKEWSAMSRPDPEKYMLKFYPKFKKSKETINSKYTPLYLDAVLSEKPDFPVKGQDLGKEGYIYNFMDSLIPHALHGERRVWNLGYDIRNTKTCCYPEDDVEDTAEWLLDFDYASKFDSIHEITNAKYELPEDKRDLYTLKSLDITIMYITNTESIPKSYLAKDKNIDTLVVPCSGLHQFEHIMGSLDTIKRVHWVDFSKYGIAWTKHVLENWNGNDFARFADENMHILDDMDFPENGIKYYDKDNVTRFESHRTKEEWTKGWARIQQLEHTFDQIDIVKEFDKIVDMVGENKNVHLQISNIWQYEINYLNTPLFEAQENFVKMINELLRNDNVVYFSGDTPGGMFYEYADMRLLPGII